MFNIPAQPFIYPKTVKSGELSIKLRDFIVEYKRKSPISLETCPKGACKCGNFRSTNEATFMFIKGIPCMTQGNNVYLRQPMFFEFNNELVYNREFCPLLDEMISIFHREEGYVYDVAWNLVFKKFSKAELERRMKVTGRAVTLWLFQDLFEKNCKSTATSDQLFELIGLYSWPIIAKLMLSLECEKWIKSPDMEWAHESDEVSGQWLSSVADALGEEILEYAPGYHFDINYYFNY